MNFTKLEYTVALLIVGLGLAVNGYSQSFLTNGLVAYYPFNGNGNDVVNGYNITNSTIPLAADRFGTPNAAAVLSQVMWATNLIYAASSDARTMSQWVKIEDYPGNTTGAWGPKPNASFVNFFESTVKGNSLASDGDFWLDNGFAVAFFHMPPPIIWSHIVVVYSGGIDTAQVYFNGQIQPLERTVEEAGDPIGFTYNSQQYSALIIPSGPGISGYSTNNFIDDIRIYNRALSTNEVQQLYSYESAPSVTLATDLAIECLGSQVVLSWPLASTNDFYLQTATNLSSPVAWSNAADPATNGSDLVVTNPIANTSTFYRLQAWEYLFDGTNTAAFGVGTAFPSNSWFVTNGMLVSKTIASAPALVTVNSYTNFELRLSWKCATNGNSGILYRATGFPEYQLFDDANVATSHYTDNTYLNPVNLMGAVYSLIAPTNKHLVPTGQWNECRVTVQGYHATHWLNGNVIVDYQINNPAYTGYLTQATNTQIAFQNKGANDHGVVPGVVYYGYIKIRRLP